jgi:hypothetical protein
LLWIVAIRSQALQRALTFLPQAISALTPKADIDRQVGNVCFVPEADIGQILCSDLSGKNQTAEALLSRDRSDCFIF